MKYETAKAKADRLLKLGDAQSMTTAAGRRTLRKCLHYRRIAKAAKAKDRR